MLIWCRAGVVGDGKALNRHQACVSHLLGDQTDDEKYRFRTFLLS